jgi:hypothetical protein
MGWFDNCKTEDDAKLLFRKLAKLFHPDKGGDNDLMMQLQSHYDSFFNLKMFPLKFFSGNIPTNASIPLFNLQLRINFLFLRINLRINFVYLNSHSM